MPDTGRRRNVHEGAVALIAVELVAGRVRGRLGKLSQGTDLVHQIQVRIAVVVIVAPGRARAHVFRQHAAALAARVDKREAALLRNLSEGNRRAVGGQGTRQTVEHAFGQPAGLGRLVPLACRQQQNDSEKACKGEPPVRQLPSCGAAASRGRGDENGAGVLRHVGNGSGESPFAQDLVDEGLVEFAVAQASRQMQA